MIAITDLTDRELADLPIDQVVFIPAKIVQVRQGTGQGRDHLEATVAVCPLTANGTRQQGFQKVFSMPGREIYIQARQQQPHQQQQVADK